MRQDWGKWACGPHQPWWMPVAFSLASVPRGVAENKIFYEGEVAIVYMHEARKPTVECPPFGSLACKQVAAITLLHLQSLTGWTAPTAPIGPPIKARAAPRRLARRAAAAPLAEEELAAAAPPEGAELLEFSQLWGCAGDGIWFPIGGASGRTPGLDPYVVDGVRFPYRRWWPGGVRASGPCQ